jgi:hypothetical protein
MTKVLPINTLNQKISTLEYADFELDVFYNIQCVFSSKKDSQLITYNGKSIYDLIHPVDHAFFEFHLGCVQVGRKPKPFKIKIRELHTKISYPVEVTIKRIDSMYRVQIKRIEQKVRTRYDSSLFINLHDNELGLEIEENQYSIATKKGYNLKNSSLTDISQIILPVLLNISTKENYIVAKKFPKVSLQTDLGTQIVKNLFKWFINKTDAFSEKKEYLVEGEINDAIFSISIKHIGSLLHINKDITDKQEMSKTYKEIQKNVSLLNGRIKNVSTNHVILKFPMTLITSS